MFAVVDDVATLDLKSTQEICSFSRRRVDGGDVMRADAHI